MFGWGSFQLLAFKLQVSSVIITLFFAVFFVSYSNTYAVGAASTSIISLTGHLCTTRRATQADLTNSIFHIVVQKIQYTLAWLDTTKRIDEEKPNSIVIVVRPIIIGVTGAFSLKSLFSIGRHADYRRSIIQQWSPVKVPVSSGPGAFDCVLVAGAVTRTLKIWRHESSSLLRQSISITVYIDWHLNACSLE